MMSVVAAAILSLSAYMVKIFPASNVNFVVKLLVGMSWMVGGSILALVPADVVSATHGNGDNYEYMDVLWQV